MNNNCSEEKRPQHGCGHNSSGSGLLMAVVVYILLVIILSSWRGY